MSIEEEIQAKLIRTETDLLIELGRSTYKSATQPNFRLRGEEFINNIGQNLSSTICKHPSIQRILSDPEAYDDVMVVTALLDCLTGILIGVSPVTVCVLLAKRGLRNLCEGCDE